jgi:glycosyltransferase involved in cell wall biosynthesis
MIDNEYREVKAELEDKHKKITVFTPVYNRAYCIENLYKSLKSQSDKNFEWIVMDDGSTDNVAELFDHWIRDENEFDIIYMKVKNGGKMRAVNKGVKFASAPAFFIVDSDDYLTNDALEFLAIQFDKIKDDHTFAGISGLRRIKTIDAKYDFDYVDATNFERRMFGLSIDMAECYKTDVLKQYPCPEIEGENYMFPSYVWNSIALDGYKLRWFNKEIYISEYRPDGLSAVGIQKYIRNPIGWGMMIQLNVVCKKDSEYTEFQYYWYYQTLKDRMSEHMIANHLGISMEVLSHVIKDKPIIIKKIDDYFSCNDIRQVALYGLGGEAKRFLWILKEVGIEVCYGIDKRPNSLLPVCYMPGDEFPEVDAILITNRAGIHEIKNNLEEITNIKCISIQEDILEKSINYYYSDI